MDERVADIISKTISGFELILAAVAGMLLVYFLIRRIRIRKKEDFEKRDN